MTARKCHECGKMNPRFFTHCVECGAKLADDKQKTDTIISVLKVLVILCIAILILIYVILPVVQYSNTFGRNFSETVSAKSASDVQKIPEYSLNSPAGNGDLEITINSARDGQNTYNANKFFIVTVSLKNLKSGGNLEVSSSDFSLVDSEGMQYIPYGIGSKVIYDLSPLQSGSAELTFVIPQNVKAKQVRFTFPRTSLLSGNHDIVAFVI